MAPAATVDVPPASALQEILDTSETKAKSSSHPGYLHNLASTIAHDLQFQHDWTALSIHTHSTLAHELLPRPVISGLPPKRAYIHPDEQIEIIKAEHVTKEKIVHKPEREWVVPSQLQDKWSLAKFAAMFDALEVLPPATKDSSDAEDENPIGQQWRGKNRQKRLFLATLHDDSTVVYYIMHDGIVKPRQN